MGMNTSVGSAAPGLRPVHHDRDGDQAEPRSVEHEKHDHGVGSGILLPVKFLKLLHGFQPQRRGCIVEPEHIGRHIHEYRPHGRMILRYSRKQPAEQRAYQTAEHTDDSGTLAYLHQAEPQRQHTGKTEGQFKRSGRRRERCAHHIAPYLHVAVTQSADQGHCKRKQEEYYPDIIEYHNANLLKVREIPVLQFFCAIFRNSIFSPNTLYNSYIKQLDAVRESKIRRRQGSCT